LTEGSWFGPREKQSRRRSISAIVAEAHFAEERIMAEIGSKAPDFALKAHDGKTVSSGDYRGSKWIVISAYPLAFTGG